jgi:hypothetical protein
MTRASFLEESVGTTTTIDEISSTQINRCEPYELLCQTERAYACVSEVVEGPGVALSHYALLPREERSS